MHSHLHLTSPMAATPQYSYYPQPLQSFSYPPGPHNHFPEPHYHQPPMAFPSPPLKLIKFSGHDPNFWLLNTELYFLHHPWPLETRFDFILLYLEGFALTWFQLWRHQLDSWEKFREVFKLQFIQFRSEHIAASRGTRLGNTTVVVPPRKGEKVSHDGGEELSGREIEERTPSPCAKSAETVIETTTVIQPPIQTIQVLKSTEDRASVTTAVDEHKDASIARYAEDLHESESRVAVPCHLSPQYLDSHVTTLQFPVGNMSNLNSNSVNHLPDPVPNDTHNVFDKMHERKYGENVVEDSIDNMFLQFYPSSILVQRSFSSHAIAPQFSTAIPDLLGMIIKLFDPGISAAISMINFGELFNCATIHHHQVILSSTIQYATPQTTVTPVCIYLQETQGIVTKLNKESAICSSDTIPKSTHHLFEKMDESQFIQKCEASLSKLDVYPKVFEKMHETETIQNCIATHFEKLLENFLAHSLLESKIMHLMILKSEIALPELQGIVTTLFDPGITCLAQLHMFVYVLTHVSGHIPKCGTSDNVLSWLILPDQATTWLINQHLFATLRHSTPGLHYNNPVLCPFIIIYELLDFKLFRSIQDAPYLHDLQGLFSWPFDPGILDLEHCPGRDTGLRKLLKEMGFSHSKGAQDDTLTKFVRSLLEPLKSLHKSHSCVGSGDSFNALGSRELTWERIGVSIYVVLSRYFQYATAQGVLHHIFNEFKPLHSLIQQELISYHGGDDYPLRNKWDVLTHFGEIQRQSKDRVATVQFNKSGNLLACQVAGKTVEIYRVLDDAEAKRKAKRRVHRKKEKKHGKEALDGTENGHNINENKEDNSTVIRGTKETRDIPITVPDVFKLLNTIRASKKICSISFCPSTPKNSLACLALSLNNNLLEFYSIQSNETIKTLAIDLQGHRSDVTSVTLSSDNTFLLSTSHNAVKIWNPSTGSGLRTIDSGYGLCSLILPTNKYGLVGTKDGTLEIIDCGSGTCLEVIEAHGGSLNSIAALPDKGGFVTGSADHDVKFWEYQIKQKPGQATKQPTVSNVRTMKMNDDVLVVVISPGAKYIAVALLDSSVKVHFVDTFKFFLSLYGHKLPVLCMDISSDGDLIVTGSADKNLKIWGLDFVKFVPRTHYVFSVGKDRRVRYWDADKFEQLLTLEGHHADIGCLAISNRGDFIVTGSHDRSIRRWDRTEEQFFIEEEKEKRLEEKFEADLDNAFENKHALKEEIQEEGAVASAGKKTEDTLTASDLIIERLDIAEAENKCIAEHQEAQNNRNTAVFQANPLMNGLSPSDYVLSAFSDVHSNDLEQTLLVLPFADALKLLSYLKEWTSYSDKVELVWRIGILLLQTHYSQLFASPAARPILTAFSDIFVKRGKGCKDIFGFNLAAMDHIKQMMPPRSKLPEICAKKSKRTEERSDTEEVRRKKKKNTT